LLSVANLRLWLGVVAEADLISADGDINPSGGKKDSRGALSDGVGNEKVDGVDFELSGGVVMKRAWVKS
jgi:hypothetical protein